ncbi:MAG TPA: T9SS type A sorting domain-containing protein [Chitinophagales bacterium]|nr:T9SS type A sorting domain-containing protein [Chitinophagales bacterium]
MKKFTVLIIISFIVCHAVHAQVIFQKIYRGAGYSASFCNSVETTSDSGYIIAGSYLSSGSSDACITKTNFSGDVEWSETFGELLSENIFSIKQTANGSYVVAGTSRSFSVDSLNEFYILQLSSSGNVDWEKIYGSLAGTYEVGAHRINQTSDGGFIIGGYEDALVGMLYLKTDADGTISWGKFIYGSIGTYGVESIRQTSDGGYIITGNGGKLIKTDASGNITWSKSYINSAMSYCAQQTSDGGYMLAGETNVYGSGGTDMYLIKTDSSGNVLWCKTFGGTLNDNLRAAEQTSDGGYILGGNTYSFGAGNTDIYVVKTDSAGNLLWSKTYGSTGDELGFSVGETSAGGFIIAGQTNSFGSGAYSAYLIRTDATGASGCNESTPLTLVTSPVVVAVTLSETAIDYIPDTDTPVSSIGGGLTEEQLCLSFPTSLTEAGSEENNFSIAPNPATDYCTIIFDKIINEGKIEFYDVLGIPIAIGTEKINNALGKEIHLKNISSGIYFVKVFEGEKFCCKKIVIEKN